MPRVFFITGCSTGFGKHLVQEVLDNGDIAVATARNPSDLSFQSATPSNYLALKLDVTHQDQIDAAFKQTVSSFGRVDVVVNNAGYGLAGPFEELTDEQIRMQMEVNYFGLVAVTRTALAQMRAQKPGGGLIQQVTSLGGQRGVAMFSIYSSSKWAVEGFTEAVAREMRPEWNINLTCVEPGGFRTDWAGRSMVFTETRHAAYNHLDPVGAMAARNGKQPGDPLKGAKAMYALACLKDPPLRAAIGSDCYQGVQDKIAQYKELYDRDDLKKIALSCDVDE